MRILLLYPQLCGFFNTLNFGTSGVGVKAFDVSDFAKITRSHIILAFKVSIIQVDLAFVTTAVVTFTFDKFVTAATGRQLAASATGAAPVDGSVQTWQSRPKRQKILVKLQLLALLCSALRWQACGCRWAGYSSAPEAGSTPA